MSFDPKFAPASRFVKWALDRFAEQTIGAESAINRLHETLPDILKNGDRFQSGVIVAEALQSLEWEWIWLEEWIKKFSEIGTQPAMWHVEPYIRGYGEDFRLFLAYNCLLKWIRERRWWEDTCRVLGYRGWCIGDPFPTNWRIYSGWKLSIVKEDIDIHLILNNEFSRFMNGDHNHRPPYFPGDVSMITMRRK